MFLVVLSCTDKVGSEGQEWDQIFLLAVFGFAQGEVKLRPAIPKTKFETLVSSNPSVS